MSKEFQWTDKLVEEFAAKFIEQRINWAVIHDCTAAPVPLHSYLDQFKKEKQKPQQSDNRDWEIVRWRTKDGGYYTDWMSAYGVKDLTIDAVKRKSDNTIFSIGDEMQHKDVDMGKTPFIISKFEICYNGIMVHGDNNHPKTSWSLGSIKKQSPPLKEDRIELYFSKHSDESFYRLYVTNDGNGKFDMIEARKILEQVLNGLSPEDLKHIELGKQIIGNTFTQQQVDDMCRDAFSAGRGKEQKVEGTDNISLSYHQFKTYEDYKQSLKQVNP